MNQKPELGCHMCPNCPRGCLCSQCIDGLGGNGTCLCADGFHGSMCQFCSNPNRYGPRCNRSKWGFSGSLPRAPSHTEHANGVAWCLVDFACVVCHHHSMVVVAGAGGLSDASQTIASARELSTSCLISDSLWDESEKLHF